MKKKNLVWIPFFGIYLTKFNPFIIKYEQWIIYQMISTGILGLNALVGIFVLAKFLMSIN